MLSLLKKIFGTSQSRLIKRYSKIVKQINEREQIFSSLSEEQLKAKTAEFKQRHAQGESLDTLLIDAYAVVKNACRRLQGTEIHISGYNQKWDMVPYDVQLIGGIAMHYGCIAEMQTGEGKTLTAALPLYLNALSGKPVHLVTVNDYLASRDCEWIGTIFRYLGLTVGALTNDVPIQMRKSVYECDIVYGTASEFGFDYLRDNSMVSSAAMQVQRGYFFAIIDEVDSILIDEARTPLIISGPSNEDHGMYDALKETVSDVVRQQRDLCNKFASDARKVLEELSQLHENPKERKKLSKEEEKKASEAYLHLWLVSKGLPHHKILKRLKEDPDIRAKMEQLETYYIAEPNKHERAEVLSQLYIIVDERSSEYELTDKGIQCWASSGGVVDDFTMLDLGYEYQLVDELTISEEEKLQKKIALREEDGKRKERAHALRQLFRAHLLMEKDVDYIVHDGKIVIIDENTGRPQPGRRFSDGLHQAIEAKERVEIQGATQTHATVTLQNYFRMYTKLSGMTGTAITEAQEFKEIYKLEVLSIPTHKTCVRIDFDDEIYMTEREKYTGLVKEIKRIHEEGRPILIGTESVEISEKLSRILRQNALPHTVLNAKNHAQEAEIIAGAGAKGAITVATNMAGRGTDIKLQSGVAALGGLHVIGTTRHNSRRIDRQLRGRGARAGDPGSAKFFVSFEDTLMRNFTSSPRITALLQRYRPPEGEAIVGKLFNNSIETAQKRIEQRNYSTRKHTLEYDDVMNRQRQEVYAFRNEILRSESTLGLAFEAIDSVAHHFVEEFAAKKDTPEAFKALLSAHFPITLSTDDLTESGIKKLPEQIARLFRLKFEHQAQLIAAIQEASGRSVNPVHVLSEILRNILLSRVDKHWQQHLLAIDHLRSEVSLRTHGQKDPLVEFKHEAFRLFHEFNRALKFDIIHLLLRFETMPPQSVDIEKAIARLQRQRFPAFIAKEEELQELVGKKQPLEQLQ